LRAADNPFAVHRVLRQRYRLTEDGWSRMVDRLAAMRNRAAIVGPKGSGKTTLLEDLAARLEARGLLVRMIRLTSAARRLPALSLQPEVVLMCDGAEQLSRLDWWRLRLRSRFAAGLVITSHHAGLLPTLHRCETSPALLEELTAALGVHVDTARCVTLHTRHRGNVREALRALYDEVSAPLIGVPA
jgi:hypothetical protein